MPAGGLSSGGLNSLLGQIPMLGPMMQKDPAMKALMQMAGPPDIKGLMQNPVGTMMQPLNTAMAPVTGLLGGGGQGGGK